MFVLVFALVSLGWYVFVMTITGIGYCQLFRYYRSKSARGRSECLSLNETLPITIIRPVKGIEPRLYDCLAATFHQSYPPSKLHIRFCIASRQDPALPILEKLLRDFRTFDAKILVQNEDVTWLNKERRDLGPNPKILNMSQAYREAHTDLIWILDDNVWVGPGVLGRMVDKLCGFGENGLRYKLVHQCPLVIDITQQGLPFCGREGRGVRDRMIRSGGGRLEEVFFTSALAKVYVGINTVNAVPCAVGKSNLFRKSHLDSLTSKDEREQPGGIDQFADGICEDHMIGDRLWKGKVEQDMLDKTKPIGTHALLLGDHAIQPKDNMSILDYVGRRTRWIRVRKFTARFATFVEHGSDSFVCSLYGAFAITNLPFFYTVLGIPPTKLGFAIFWCLSVVSWVGVDWVLYRMLHSLDSIEIDENTPEFITEWRVQDKPFRQWLLAWIGRETLAFPIWFRAVFLGSSLNWRGQVFRVGLDEKVHTT